MEVATDLCNIVSQIVKRLLIMICVLTKHNFLHIQYNAFFKSGLFICRFLLSP